MVKHISHLLSCCRLLAASCLMAVAAGCNQSTNMEQQVNELYDKMSQEERIAQLRSLYMDLLFDEQGL